MKFKVLAKTIHELYGHNGLTYYLQGSGGKCPACGCKTPPHEDDCEFVKEAKLLLETFYGKGGG